MLNLHPSIRLFKFMAGLGIVFTLSIYQANAQNEIVNYDFNDTDQGWSTTNGWVRDNVADTKFHGSDGNYWHTTPFDNYNNNMNVVITSPVIDLSNYGYLTLEMDIAYKTESGWDGFLVEYYNGNSWQVLGTSASGNNWYNNDDVDALGNNEYGWTGNNRNWITANIALPTALENNKNAQFRVRFASDYSITKDGVAFDNFKITGYYTTTKAMYTFNNSDENWTVSSGWVRDNSADYKFSGSDGKYWHTIPFDNYTNNMTAIVTSPMIDLSETENLLLVCDVRYNTKSNDGLTIQYFDGSNWQIAGTYGSGNLWYNNTDIDGIANNADGWTGDNSFWQTASVQLPEALENNSQAQFRVVFGSNNRSTDDGVAFDNFKITSFSETPPIPPKTWYAYASDGNWSDASSWTLDPATNPIYINPDNQLPAETDYVVIPAGKKINIQTSSNNLTISRININGKLDVGNSSGHNFGEISGNGTLLLSGYDSGSGILDNFPDGIAINFINPEHGGTVEIYGSGLILNQDHEFNNLRINLNAGTVTLLSNLIVNGDLHVLQGTFQINDNSHTQTRNTIIYGNVLVASGAKISVGTANATNNAAHLGYGNYHKYFHQFTVYGNFTNQGTVKFTNLTQPDFANRATNGAVTLVFSGASNNTFNCEGTTNLYYLVIDKGTNNNYQLIINATDTSYFGLFGDNQGEWDATDPNNPENRKALWIKSGTLTLEGYTSIPSLTEGTRDYVIGENAALILNGKHVQLHITNVSENTGIYPAINYSGLPYNSSSGISNTDSHQGIYIMGSLTINNGKLFTSNSHGLVYSAESTAAALHINGGTVKASQFRISGYTDSISAKMTYSQTGGELFLLDNKTNAAIFDLSAKMGSFTMSGGTIYINDISNGTPNAIEIGCEENNINVSGGTIIIDNANGTNGVASIQTTAPLHNLVLRSNQNNGLKLLSELHITNDLIVESENFNANNFNVYIASDLNVAAAGGFITGNNTIIFDGEKQTKLYLPSLQTFNNIKVDKNIDQKNLTISTAPINAFTVNGNFELLRGTFDYGEFTIKLQGNLTINDTIGLSENTGKIILSGSTTQHITANQAQIKNLEIDNNSGVLLNGDLSISGNLHLSNGIFNIQSYKLTLADTAAQISGDFSENIMIQTNGLASDGGINYYIDTAKTLVFPLGTNANGNLRYTPAIVTLSNVSDNGFLRISVADEQIPMTLSNCSNTASYFWKTNYSGFETLPYITSYTFILDASDLPDNTDNLVAGKVLNTAPFTQSTEENNYNAENQELVFNSGFPLEKASYSLGSAECFTLAPNIYYSRKTGNFSDTNTWSKNDSTGNGLQEVPIAGSMIVIQNAHRINVHHAIPDLSGVIFKHNYDSLPDAGSEDVARLQFFEAGTYNLGEVKGPGMVSFNTTNNPNVLGDFGKFAANPDAYFLYFGADATLNNIPQPAPNIMVESATFNINQNLEIFGDLIIQGNGTLIPKKNIEIFGNLVIGCWLGGTFVLPSQSNSVSINIHQDIDFTKDPLNNPGTRNLLVKHQNSKNVIHKIVVGGNILQGDVNATIDLWNSNTMERAILELQGKNNNTYSRISGNTPELYRLVMNKGIDTTYSFTFNQSVTLNGNTNTSDEKTIELNYGKLVFNSANFNLDLTSGQAFNIPDGAALELKNGTFKASGTSGGINLNGTLIISGGTLDMDNTNDDNFIAYGSSGAAHLLITDGYLIVGTQIRRVATNDAGILNYTQTGGHVSLGTSNNLGKYNNNRGILEVLNSESNFTFTGGSLTLAHQNGNTPEVAALILHPDNYEITKTLTLGNDQTSDSEELNINSSVPLMHLNINCNSQLLVNPLTINGNLTLEQKANIDAKGLTITIGGDFTNNGVYTASSNTLVFSSDNNQTLGGTGTETIFKCTKSGNGTLTLNKNIDITDALIINSGSIQTDTYALNVSGNVYLEGTINSSSGSGLVLSGNSEQLLNRLTTGNSNIDILTINNNNGVKISEIDHGFTINKLLRLESGIFNIAGNLLTLSQSATIEDVNPFSANNMIQTNSSFQDNGIKKYFEANYTTDFIFPVGQTTYSPVIFDFESSGNTSGNTTGSITIRPAHEYHPIINDGTDNLSTGDINNVLNYYWIIRAENLTGFTSNVNFNYSADDIRLTEPGYSVTDYIPACILTLNNPSAYINKFSANNLDTDAQQITFNFNQVTDINITGEYFAGIDPAIPSNVQVYTSVDGGGNITSTQSFDTPLVADGVAPAGAILVVAPGDEIRLNVNHVNLYQTKILEGATLTIDETNYHRLGTVTGTGIIKIISNSSGISFPAGDYIDFFTCTGGSLEYEGSGNYSILSGLSTVKQVTLNGSGDKELANNNISICNNFNLNGPNFINSSNKNINISGNLNINGGNFYSGLDNNIVIDGSLNVNGGQYYGELSGTDQINTLNITGGAFHTGSGGSIYIEGNISFTGGIFDGGTGTAKLILNGSELQTLEGTFTNNAAFNNLEINNPNGITLMGDVELNNALELNDGIVNTENVSLTLTENAYIIPEEGKTNAFINGKLSKIMAYAGDHFIFPVGKSGQRGFAGVHNVTTAGLTWDVEYFNKNATTESAVSNLNPTDVLEIVAVSKKEYWKISDNGSSNATITLSWNANSDVSDIQTEREKLKVLAWNGNSWDNFGGGSFSAGHTQISGSFKSTSLLPFSENIITLGSGDESNPLPVELIYFAANSNIDNVELLWGTASEKNNDYFEIQRADDAVTFYTLGSVAGFGNSNTQIDYTFVDEIPIDGISYYRLKQVDYNGKFTYHKIIKVDWEQFVFGEDDEIQVFPNPYVSGELSLALTNLEPYASINLLITDFNGNVKYNFSLTVPDSKNLNLIPMAMDHLDKGIYFLTVTTSKNKFIKKIIVE